VACTTDHLRSLVLAVVVVSVAIVFVLLFSEGGAEPAVLVMNGAFLLLAVASGDAVRARRAYRAEREHERRAEAQRLVAEERLRIAREVHDVVAHAMVAINVQAGVAAHVVDRRPEQARSALQEIKATSGSALRDLRATLGALRADGTAPSRPTEGVASMHELASPLRAAGVEVDLTVRGAADEVPTAVGAAAYRIVQEAATNILRHAGARRARIAVEIGRDAVELRVDDDGAALVAASGPAVAGSGSGLRGMAERAAMLGGRLTVGRADHGGWRVHAVLPFA
jgi:signal transduction histidine kinase